MKTKKFWVRAEENEEKESSNGRKPRKAGLEQRKTKKGGVRAEENQEKRG